MNKKEDLYTKDRIRTFTGLYVDVFDLQLNDICIEDIAHSLSFIPRFAGHLPTAYSVAQHSLACYQNTRYYKLESLLHDASEAYLSDIPSPIKNRLPDYKSLEHKVLKRIFEKFELIYPLPDEVKSIDKISLEWEWNNIMLGTYESKFTQKKIELEFLRTFYNEIYKK